MRPYIPFTLLGLLVGTLTGLSNSSVVVVLIPALFALIGGSLLLFISKLKDDDRIFALQGITGISAGCLIGVFSSIYISEHQLLSPIISKNSAHYSNQENTGRKYLRAVETSEILALEEKVNNGLVLRSDGYDQLMKLLRKIEK